MLNQINEFDSCSTQGCLSDQAYAIVNTETKRLHRISFSASLLQHILKTGKNHNLEVSEITFRLGRVLRAGETSSTGIYALVKTKNDWTLRISLHKNVANYLCDFNTRSLRECHVIKVH